MNDSEIVERLIQAGSDGLGAGDLLSLSDIDRTTLFRKLKSLHDNGVVSVTGSGRYTRYFISKNSLSYIRWELSQDPSLRDPVFYNENLLNNYVPNETFLLGDSDLAELEQSMDESIKSASDKDYRAILNALVIDLSHASSVLEGVNISWIDTKELIDTNEAPADLDNEGRTIVLNHKNAIKFIVENNVGFVRRDLLDIHSLLMKDLFREPGREGALRVRKVELGTSKYTPPFDPNKIREYFDLTIEKAAAIKNPFEQSLFCMLMFPYLQPFSDGNRRTSRLLSNLPFINERMAPFSYASVIKRDYNFGLLAFYERGRHEILADVFKTAYLKTAAHYNNILLSVMNGVRLADVDGEEIDAEVHFRRNRPT